MSAMASSVASKRVPLVCALEKLLVASSAPGAGSTTVRPLAVAGGLREYNTGAQLRRYERGESDEDSVREYEDRRRGRDYAVPGLSSGSRPLRAMISLRSLNFGDWFECSINSFELGLRELTQFPPSRCVP
jgi:hypothetical protein